MTQSTPAASASNQMAHKKFDKLVRDKIPQIVESRGGVAITHIANDTEYWQRLRTKLQEEVGEFLEDTNIEEELADVLEVIRAICEFKGIDPVGLEKLRDKKATERGGFGARIVLEETVG